MLAKESGKETNGEPSLDPLLFVATHSCVTRARFAVASVQKTKGLRRRLDPRTVLDSGFNAVDSGFQFLEPGFFVNGTWIPDSNYYRDSVFLELQSRLQSPGFRITQARIARILNSTRNNFPDTGIRIPSQWEN